MKRNKKFLILLNLILVILLFNYSIYQKEQMLHKGKLVLLPLAPVDPRSLIQGDYMVLNYDLGRSIPDREKLPKRGYAIVRLNENNVAEVLRLQKDLKPISNGELPIRYFTGSHDEIRIGAESYFFEEGKSEKFTAAKFGGIKIDSKGNSLLIGLYDDEFHQLGSKN